MDADDWGKKRCLQLVFFLTLTVKTLESSKMKLTGKVTVPSLKEEVSLAKESHLTVKFEDTSMMDAPSVVLGKQEQALPERTKVGRGAEPLNYTIVCDKPKNLGPSFYSISAVLNVGWRPSDEEWLRKGDFFNDATHNVDITEDSDHFVQDIEMVLYQH